ncbi:MAG: helix-turn-helix domain-containing protein [Methylococcaceae bacterium]|nr:helix-turn-helix domain-containing protein [Methylococcaceae bacterium]
MIQNTDENTFSPRTHRIVTLLAAGESVRSTAREVGVHRTTVHRILGREDVRVAIRDLRASAEQELMTRLPDLLRRSLDVLEAELVSPIGENRRKAASTLLKVAGAALLNRALKNSDTVFEIAPNEKSTDSTSRATPSSDEMFEPTAHAIQGPQFSSNIPPDLALPSSAISMPVLIGRLHEFLSRMPPTRIPDIACYCLNTLIDFKSTGNVTRLQEAALCAAQAKRIEASFLPSGWQDVFQHCEDQIRNTIETFNSGIEVKDTVKASVFPGDIASLPSPSFSNNLQG